MCTMWHCRRSDSVASGRSGGDLKDSDYAADQQDGEDRRPDSPRTMMIKANLAKVTCHLPDTDSSLS